MSKQTALPTETSLRDFAKVRFWQLSKEMLDIGMELYADAGKAYTDKVLRKKARRSDASRVPLAVKLWTHASMYVF